MVATLTGLTIQRLLAEVRAARDRLSGVLEAATETAIIAGGATGTEITLFNAGAERMLGYRADEVVGVATPALFHDADEVAARAAELGVEPGMEVFIAVPGREGSETRAVDLRAQGRRAAPRLADGHRRARRGRRRDGLPRRRDRRDRARPRAGGAEGRARPHVRRHRHGRHARRRARRRRADHPLQPGLRAASPATRRRTCSAGGRGSMLVPPEQVETVRARLARDRPGAVPDGVRDRLAHRRPASAG